MLKVLTFIDNALAMIEKPIMFIFGFALFYVMCHSVIARYFFHTSSPWMMELPRMFHIWMCFVGGSYLIRTNGHPAVGYFSDKIRDKGDCLQRRLYFTFTYLAMIIFVGSTLYFAWQQIPLFMMQRTMYLRMPFIYVNGGALLGLALMNIRLLIKIGYVWKGELR